MRPGISDHHGRCTFKIHYDECGLQCRLLDGVDDCIFRGALYHREPFRLARTAGPLGYGLVGIGIDDGNGSAIAGELRSEQDGRRGLAHPSSGTCENDGWHCR